ncbi:DUF6455 family protein [Tranquillimonas alkanivorans]|nr:DUF6455 family protein [Tranquillimonas alkanivorans]
MSRYDRHAMLVNRMADTAGVDLGEALQRGRITPDDLSDLVFSCVACRDADACPKWLDDHAGRTVPAPGFCRNKPWFEARRAEVVADAPRDHGEER